MNPQPPASPPGARIRRAFDRAALTYDHAASVQRETLRELVAALPDLALPKLASKAAPRAPRLVDVGCGTGAATPLLAARFPNAQLIGVDFAPAMLRASPITDDQLQTPSAPAHKICADAARLPLPDASTDLVFSSLTYQWCNLPAVLREAHRVLRPGGTLAFSTLTPGTFAELTHAFAGIDRHPHTLALLDPLTIMQTVETAGFARIVKRAICHTARYPDLRSVLHGIRDTGASEISGRRRAGLLGKTAWHSIEARYRELADAQGLLPLSYVVLEIIAHRAPLSGPGD